MTPFGSLPTQISSNPVTLTSGKNTVLVAPTSNLNALPLLTMGDINGDGKIDINDYAILASCLGNTSGSSCVNYQTQLLAKFPSLPKDFIPGDLNDNGVVDGIDYNILLRGLVAGAGN